MVLLHPASTTGVIVLTRSVRLCVSLSHVNGQTHTPEFWQGGQVEGYLGQVHWARSWVKGQDHQVKNRFLIYISMAVDWKPILHRDCPTTDIFPISTYIGCNRLMYNPDHLLFSVLISTGYDPDLFQPKLILGRY